MFARSLRVACGPCSRRGLKTGSLSQNIVRRRYSHSFTPAGNNPTSPVAALGGLSNELDRLSPRFDINASQLTILKDPSEFYETLKVGLVFCFLLILL